MVRSCDGRRTHRDFGRPNWRIMNYGIIRWLPNFDTCTTRNIGAWWFLPIRVGFKVRYDHTTQFHIEREFKVQVVAVAVDPSTATRFVSFVLTRAFAISSSSPCTHFFSHITTKHLIRLPWMERWILFDSSCIRYCRGAHGEKSGLN